MYCLRQQSGPKYRENLKHLKVGRTGICSIDKEMVYFPFVKLCSGSYSGEKADKEKVFVRKSEQLSTSSKRLVTRLIHFLGKLVSMVPKFCFYGTQILRLRIS